MFSAKQYVLPMICSLECVTLSRETYCIYNWYPTLHRKSAQKAVFATPAATAASIASAAKTSSMGLNRNARQPAPKAPAPKPVDQRGKEWQAERLTGARAQRGIDAAGRPRYVYEVKWAGVDPKTKEPFKNTYEPAACLIGWACFTPRLRVAHREAVAPRRTLR